MVSVIILTKNEERDIATCLSSLLWCDDIHILDSYSSDNTIAIAKTFNVSVTSNAFVSFGHQRNFALDTIPVKYPWILFLDADEVCSEAFKTAVLNAIQSAENNVAGYYCCWKMMLNGTWLKHCDNFPKWQFRLLRKDSARFTDFGHGQKEYQVKGQIGYIKEPYIHYGFSKGWSAWVERHNRYSTQEAIARLQQRPPFKNILSKHGSVRNPALKSWLCRIPGWPLLRFFQAYILKLGFLEGNAAFMYCVNMAYYEFLIKIKMNEIKKQQ